MSLYQSSVQSIIDDNLDSAYTVLPGTITAISIRNGATVLSVQTGVSRVTEDNRAFEDPILDDVPIVWPSSGNCFITVPLEVGSTVLLHFAMRNCVEWKNGDGSEVYTPFMPRRFNQNDVFATPSMLPYSLSPEVDSEAVRISSGATEIRVLKDGTIELGEGATEALLKGTAFKTLFDSLLAALATHTHPVSGSTAAASVDLNAAITSNFPGNALPDNILSEVSKTI